MAHQKFIDSTMDCSNVISEDSLLSNNSSGSAYRFIKNLHFQYINTKIIETGPQAGYTALHIACLEDNISIVHLLIRLNHSINPVARDGAQPIHLAAFFNHLEVLEVLINPNNVDAEFEKYLFLKYGMNEWSDDFGGKMTMFIFAVLNNRIELARILLEHQAKVKVKSVTNKTLLMYAVELGHEEMVEFLTSMVNDQQWVNSYDDDGQHVLDYFSKNNTDSTNLEQPKILMDLLKAGANVDVDRSGVILDQVVYGFWVDILKVLMLRCFSISSRALQIVTQPTDPNLSLDDNRRECTKLILEYLSARRGLGLTIPFEEKKLMDTLMEENYYIQFLVKEYQEKFINGLKKKFIEIGGQKVTLFDFAEKIRIDRKLKQLLNEKLKFHKEALKVLRRIKVERFDRDFSGYNDYRHCFICFLSLIKNRITSCVERSRLLQELQKVEGLQTAFPVPYEIVLMVVDYMNERELRVLINAFYI